jgi:hypothetical protein
MYRIVKLSGRYLGTSFQSSLDDEIVEEIEEFIHNDEPVLIVAEKEDVENFMDPDLVKWV